jgi:hypothetical protein
VGIWSVAMPTTHGRVMQIAERSEWPHGHGADRTRSNSRGQGCAGAFLSIVAFSGDSSSAAWHEAIQENRLAACSATVTI